MKLMVWNFSIIFLAFAWPVALVGIVLAVRHLMRLWQDDPEIGYELKTWPLVLLCLAWEYLEVAWDAFTRGVHRLLDRLPVDDAEPESIHYGKRWAVLLVLAFAAASLHASTLIYGRTAVWWLSEADYQAAHGNTTTAAVCYARAESATAGAKDGSPDDYTHRKAEAGRSALTRTAEVKP